MAILRRLTGSVLRFAICFAGTVLCLLAVDRLKFVSETWSKPALALGVIVIPVLAFFVGIGWGRRQRDPQKPGAPTVVSRTIMLLAGLALWLVAAFWLAKQLAEAVNSHP
jgi:hypothetical protein